MAKEQLQGKIGVLFAIILLCAAISFAGTSLLTAIPVVGSWLSTFLIIVPLTLSLCIIFLGITKGTRPEVKDLFSGYADLWSAIKVQFFACLFILLWSLLFIIPGIIKAFSYSMAFYVLAENKGMSALEAIRKSKELMDGHKMDLFVLGLSFIGWSLVVAFTFGLAAIWVVPYMETTAANFYNSIK